MPELARPTDASPPATGCSQLAWKRLSSVVHQDMEAACGDSGASQGDDDLAAASVAMYQIPDGLGDLAHANDPTRPPR
jgi:hypothetical protein